MTRYTAIQVNDEATLEIVQAIDPTLVELDYEKDVKDNFYVLNFPEQGKHALVPVTEFYPRFDHIENGVVFRLKKFVTE